MRHSTELGIEDGYEHFKARYDKGFRVVSYAMSGAPARHSFVLRKPTASAPEQRMSSRPRKGGTGNGSFHQSMVEQAAEGYYPAYVGGFGPPHTRGNQHTSCRLSAVYEKAAPASANLKPYMIEPVVWGLGSVGAKDFVNALADAEKAGFHARSVGVVGTPTKADLDLFVGDEEDSGLRFFATMWPRPNPGFGWAVHLTPNVPNNLPDEPRIPISHLWRKRWETRALSTQAYPVAGSVTRSRMEFGDLGPQSLTLSLWHDVRYKPWPEGDPFEPHDEDSGTELSFELVIADDLHVKAKLEAAASQHDRLPLSVGATRTTDRTIFFLPLGRPGSEEPMPRQQFVADPYDDPGGLVPHPGKGGSSSSPGGRVNIQTELAAWPIDRMKGSGARHGQLVVVRRGALYHAAAHTWAEPGYPMCTLDHAIRLGSVSKSLTAMLLLHEVVPNLTNGLDTIILRPDLLDVSDGSPAPLLYLVDLLQLVSMNAGLRPWDQGGSDYFSVNAMLTELGGAPRSAWDQAFDIIEPGAYSRWFAQHKSNDYFEVNPGSTCHFDYTNESFILLGEMLANHVENHPARYEEASRRILEHVGISPGRQHLASRGWPAARANGESPCQVRTPGHVWNRFKPPQSKDYICPAAYGLDGLHNGGAGGWCVPLVWFARILRALCPLPGRKRYLSRQQLEQMAELADPSCGNNQAHGAYRLPDTRFTFRPDGQFPSRTHDVVRICHNGMVEGGTALWAHQFPVDDRSGLQRDTISFCVAFNQDMPHEFGEAEATEIFDILQRMEIASPLPSLDLFDALG